VLRKRSGWPTRAVDPQEAVAGMAAGGEVRDERCVAVSAARDALCFFKSNKEHGQAEGVIRERPITARPTAN
jgi:hypothetical protein